MINKKPVISILKGIIREPLLHFLLLGAGLFALFYQVADPEQDRPNRILVTQVDVERLQNQWRRQWRRPPTARELDGMIESHIREMILYREALALGLDQDDVIVRRRLGQRLEFMFKDLAEQAEPAEDELEAFLQENPERYTQPERYSFSHLYLSQDKRGADTESDAIRILRQLQAQPDDVDPVQLSDRFLHQYRFDEQSPEQISRVFGKLFASKLAALTVGTWQGPIESGYGLHLVFIDRRTKPRQPILEEVRDKVRWDVIEQRRQAMDAAFYKELRQRYQIDIETPDGSPRKLSLKSDP